MIALVFLSDAAHAYENGWGHWYGDPTFRVLTSVSQTHKDQWELVEAAGDRVLAALHRVPQQHLAPAVQHDGVALVDGHNVLAGARAAEQVELAAEALSHLARVLAQRVGDADLQRDAHAHIEVQRLEHRALAALAELLEL